MSGFSARRAAKSAVAAAARLPLAATRPLVQPYVVGYHRVVEDFDAEARRTIPALLVTRATLERQLDWIARHFRVASLDEIGAALEEGRPFDKPVAALTFDDGFQDNFELARPLLLRKGLPAAFFVVTDMVGRPAWQIFDRLYRLLVRAVPGWDDARRTIEVLERTGVSRSAADVIHAAAGPDAATGRILATTRQDDVLALIASLEREAGPLDAQAPPLMSWDAVRVLRRDGFIIGSHTRTHAWLPAEASARVADELRASREALKRELGGSVSHFAYPAGEFTGAVVDDVADAGYRFAYTICAHRLPRHPQLTIPRELLWEHSATAAFGGFSPSQMACHVRGMFSGMNGCRQAHGD